MNDKAAPYIDNAGNLVIPINCDSKYRYWSGGQHLADTLWEVKVTECVWEKYTERPYPSHPVNKQPR